MCVTNLFFSLAGALEEDMSKYSEALFASDVVKMPCFDAPVQIRKAADSTRVVSSLAGGFAAATGTVLFPSIELCKGCLPKFLRFPQQTKNRAGPSQDPSTRCHPLLVLVFLRNSQVVALVP